MYVCLLLYFFVLFFYYYFTICSFSSSAMGVGKVRAPFLAFALADKKKITINYFYYTGVRSMCAAYGGVCRIDKCLSLFLFCLFDEWCDSC